MRSLGPITGAQASSVDSDRTRYAISRLGAVRESSEVFVQEVGNGNEVHVHKVGSDRGRPMASPNRSHQLVRLKSFGNC
jgi:hypothetical protein